VSFVHILIKVILQFYSNNAKILSICQLDVLLKKASVSSKASSLRLTMATKLDSECQQVLCVTLLWIRNSFACSLHRKIGKGKLVRAILT